MNESRSEVASVTVPEGRPEASPAARLRVERLTKRFGRRAVLRGIDLAIPAGQRVVLFGPNGAGKTTLLRILATLSRPTAGRVVIDGVVADRDAQAARRRVGVVAHQTYLYDDLTAAENLRFYARLYDLADIPGRVAEVLELVGLAPRADDRVRTFSRGMQQRLAIARAILHRPPVLLLDEPDTGLDREGLAVLERILAEHAAAGGSVLMTTHDLAFGFETADRVLLLDQGRIALDAPVDGVSAAEIDQRLVVRR